MAVIDSGQAGAENELCKKIGKLVESYALGEASGYPAFDDAVNLHQIGAAILLLLRSECQAPI